MITITHTPTLFGFLVTATAVKTGNSETFAVNSDHDLCQAWKTFGKIEGAKVGLTRLEIAYGNRRNVENTAPIDRCHY